MSLLDDVLRETRTGARAGVVAQRLGIDPGLAEAALDHWVRTGVVTRADALGLGCTTCAPADADGRVPAACRGCPVVALAPRRR